MNPDSRLMPKSISNLVTFMKQKKRSGIAGPLVLNEDGSFQWSCRRGIARPFAVFCYFLGIAKLFPKYPIFTGYHLNHLDVKEIILDKIKINGQKYPVSKSKGIATKYNDL